jgi:pyrroloquinoline quinone biosynthesis protein B
MFLRVLGSAAGGGYPQWNCDCPTCRAVRDGTRPARPRTQSSVAVSADGHSWFLLNASPDVLLQIEATPALHPRADRTTPLAAVLLTDGELDHTLGLLLLREGRTLHVHATPAVHEILRTGTGVLATLEKYCPVQWHEVVLGADTALGGALSYRAFDVPTTKRDRFGTGAGPGRVVGYRFTDGRTGRAAVYLPGVQQLVPSVLDELDRCACLLVDGTCWSDDELVALGLAEKTSRSMGHLPIDGPDGSLARLAALPIERKVYLHINNTNPVLLEDSPQRRELERRGMEVAVDGLQVEV